MKSWKRAAILVAALAALGVPMVALAAIRASGGSSSPDFPPSALKGKGKAEEENGDYLRRRDEYIARLHGIEPGRFANQLWRARAVARERAQKQQLLQAAQQPQTAPSQSQQA